MRTIFCFFFIFLTTTLFAQEGYRIDLRVVGLKDTTAHLAYYLQENIYLKDTATVDSQGRFFFDGPKTLPQGIYLLVVNKTKLFDFVVGADQRFGLETSTADYTKIAVKGDEDNRLYVEHLVFNADRYKEIEPFVKVLQDSTLKEELKKPAREKYNAAYKKVQDYQQAILDQHPKTLTARMIRSMRPVAIPDPPRKADGTVDSTFQLRYYRQHYFDNFDLADEAMLRTQKVFYWEKVKDYLDRLFVQHPDSLTRVIDGLVSIARKNQETYKYLVWNCIVHYQQPAIMGLDEVYVNLVDKYIATGEMDYWLDKKTAQNLQDYASKVRRGMIGRTGANLVMLNEHLQPKSLYDIRSKYTIILFFKPTCGTCREEAPKLVAFYNANKTKLGLEVFAVATDTSMKEMKEFIRDMKTPWITVNGPRSYTKTHFSELYFAESTPTLYILDDRKKIIARKLGVEQLSGFFENYQRMIARKGL